MLDHTKYIHMSAVPLLGMLCPSLVPDLQDELQESSSSMQLLPALGSQLFHWIPNSLTCVIQHLMTFYSGVFIMFMFFIVNKIERFCDFFVSSTVAITYKHSIHSAVKMTIEINRC